MLLFRPETARNPRPLRANGHARRRFPVIVTSVELARRSGVCVNKHPLEQLSATLFQWFSFGSVAKARRHGQQENIEWGKAEEMKYRSL